MLKIAIFGAGHLGKIHIELIQALDAQYEIVGFYDTNPITAAQIEETYGIPYYEDFMLLIDQADVIDIVTPTKSHFEIASIAIRKFKHVFIEKPLTETLEEGKKLLDLSREANVVVQVGYVERFNPAFVAIKDQIDQPMFFEIHRLANFNPRGTDVPVVLDLMIHDLDILLSLVKSGVKKVSASGVAIVSDSPDIANARIEFDNGCVANVTASRISLTNMRKTRIFQRSGYIAIDFLKKTSEFIQIDEVEGEPDPFDMVIDLGEGKKSKKIALTKPTIEMHNAIQKELEHFYECLTQHKKSIVSIEDGYDSLVLATKIMEQMQFSNHFSSTIKSEINR